MALASGSRAQTIHHMHLDNVIDTDNKLTFFYDVPLKTSKPGKKPHTLVFERFNDRNRCVVHILKEYVARTKNIRSSKHFWISFRKPHGKVQKDTISRWLKTVFLQAGVDLEFKAHSFRSASTSQAASAGVGLKAILDTANWSSATNFERFYHKETKETCSGKSAFAKGVLSKPRN